MNAPAPSNRINTTSGAVLVVGGGVAGVQAALDLSDLGYKVYLVEKSAAIGGVMARLDKTFPTNDCSLCILAPKLVEAGRDPNIDILTKSELLDLAGEPGRFTARVQKAAALHRRGGLQRLRPVHPLLPQGDRRRLQRGPRAPPMPPTSTTPRRCRPATTSTPRPASG